MKGRFNTVDIIAACVELNAKFHGLRVYNIYDCDHKTYLIRLVGPDAKAMLLVESGTRIHSTAHDWPKSASPSGFSMKLRKHLRGRRFEHVNMFGIDRIVDFQFGSGEAAYHLIVELYDIGNIVLTDHSYTILNILRRRTDKESATRFSNHALYPVHLARQKSSICTTTDEIIQALNTIDDTKQQIKRALGIMEISPYGVALLQHCMLQVGMNPNDKLKQFIVSETATPKPAVTDSTMSVVEIDKNLLTVSRVYRDDFIEQIQKVVLLAEVCIQSLRQSVPKGYIMMIDPPPMVSKSRKKKAGEDDAVVIPEVSADDNVTPLRKQFDEFHPMLYDQLADKPNEEFDSFLIAVDTYYSQIEEQRLTNKIAVHQLQAADKLLAVRRDHKSRLRGLRSVQEIGVRRAELIALNRELVDDVVEFLNNLIAVGMSWQQIEEFIQVEQAEGDPVACRILRLDLEHNAAIIVLNDPFADSAKDEAEAADDHNSENSVDESTENSEDNDEDEKPVPETRNKRVKKSGKAAAADADAEWHDVTIDLQLNAFQNMQKLHTEKRTALKKEEKTLQSSEVALRNAERKANEAMRTVSKIQNIHKSRKTFWFEKFQWFLSSDGILVIAGRDRQQNELIVKRHLTERDLYVHAELHGASSVVIKNALKAPVSAADEAADSTLPDRTLREAGIFSACLSHAWSENVSTRAWWVFSYQVSKTAPTGEYLPTGSFMIRGKKNFLPMEPMVMGFGFLFKLDDVSAERRLKQQNTAAVADAAAQTEAGSESRSPNEIETNGEAVASDADDAEFPDIQLNAGRSKVTVKSDVADAERNEFDIVDKTYAADSNVPARGNAKTAAAAKQQQQKQRGGAQKKSSVDNSAKEPEQKQPDAATTTNKTTKPHQEVVEKRGAKNKKRMQRKKYADQDDEERLLRTKLYKTKEQARELFSANNSTDVRETLPAEQDSNGAGGDNAKHKLEKRKESVDDAVGAAGDNLAVNKNDEDNEDDEAAEDAVVVEPNAGAAVIDDAFDDNLIELNEETFVSSVCADPTPEDSLLWCIPVCSPYITLTNAKYKYKVKLIPAAAQANSANMKRSKIVKSVVAVMTQQKDATELEKDFIKAIKDQDLYKSIIGNAKIGLAAQVLKKVATKGKKKKVGSAADAVDV